MNKSIGADTWYARWKSLYIGQALVYFVPLVLYLLAFWQAQYWRGVVESITIILSLLISIFGLKYDYRWANVVATGLTFLISFYFLWLIVQAVKFVIKNNGFERASGYGPPPFLFLTGVFILLSLTILSFITSYFCIKYIRSRLKKKEP